MILTILIPVLNEAKILEDELCLLNQEIKKIIDYNKKIEVIIIDAGSKDESPEIIEILTRKYNWSFYFNQLSPPSVAKTIEIGIPYIKSHYLLILPIDCRIDSGGIQKLLQVVGEEKYDYGGFAKNYLPTTSLLSLYSFAQNLIRTQFLKNLVWTNGIWIKKSLLDDSTKFNKDGFLEDVIFSDNLKGCHFHFINHPIFVSSRRYYPRRSIKRIFLNFLIISLYRLGYRNLKKLKFIYLSLK